MNIHDLDLIGGGDVCKICKFTNQYLQNLLLREKIPAKFVAGRWIFLRSDVEIFQKEREEKAKKDKRIILK